MTSFSNEYLVELFENGDCTCYTMLHGYGSQVCEDPETRKLWDEAKNALEAFHKHIGAWE